MQGDDMKIKLNCDMGESLVFGKWEMMRRLCHILIWQILLVVTMQVML